MVNLNNNNNLNKPGLVVVTALPCTSQGNQFAANKENLYKPKLIARDEFEKLVSFQHADMNK